MKGVSTNHPEDSVPTCELRRGANEQFGLSSQNLCKIGSSSDFPFIQIRNSMIFLKLYIKILIYCSVSFRYRRK